MPGLKSMFDMLTENVSCDARDDERDKQDQASVLISAAAAVDTEPALQVTSCRETSEIG
jgi:hypothetical protein